MNASTKTSQNRPVSHKLPARYTPMVFAFFMSLIMALLMSMIITAANQGFSAAYPSQVMHSYVLAMPVAFVCVMLVRPLVLRLVSLTVESRK